MTKICNGCGAEKNIEDFPFTDKKRGYRHPKCRDCRRIQKQNWVAQNREHVRSYGTAYWESKGKQRSAEKRRENPEPCRRQAQRWRQNNPEAAKASRQRFLETHKEYLHEYEAQRWQIDRERLSAKNKKWCAEHHIEKAAREAYHRVRRRGNHAERIDYRAILTRDNWICHICHEAVTPETLSFDHVIPISKGGPHTFENVKVAHRSCNSRKGAKVA